MYCLKHRLNLIKTLKVGSYIFLNTKNKVLNEVTGQWDIKMDPVTKLPVRGTAYGFVIARSGNYVTVATPKKIYNKATNKYSYDTFEFVDINVADMRNDRDYDVLKIYSNTLFDRAIINVLNDVNKAVKSHYKSDTDQVEEALNSLNDKDTIDVEGVDLNETKALDQVWVKQMFYNDTDRNDEGMLDLSA